MRIASRSLMLELNVLSTASQQVQTFAKRCFDFAAAHVHCKAGMIRGCDQSIPSHLHTA